jgi:glycosyltransferase involved in cell wall biosynthesis
MKVSIITPSFNQCKYIKECVESVSSQTYKNIEHIIIDNLSTDGTVEYLHSLTVSNLKFVSKKDAGQGDAINKGFALSNGEIIMWLNADDFLANEFVIHNVVEKFYKDKDVDIVYGGVEFVNQAGSFLRYVPPLKASLDMLNYVAYIGNSNILVSREVFLNCPIDMNYHFVIDHEWIMRIFRCNFRYKIINIPITKFRKHSEAKTSLYSFKRKEEERNRRNKIYNLDSKNVKTVKKFYYRALFFVMTFYGRRQVKGTVLHYLFNFYR